MMKTKKTKKVRKTGRILLFLVVLLLALAASGYMVYANQYQIKFLEGTFINGIDVSERTVEEAEALLASLADTYTLSLTFRGDVTETITAEQIGYVYVPGEEIENLLARQNRFLWIRGKIGDTYELTAGMSFDYDREMLKDVIRGLPEVQAENVTEPQDAYMQLGESDRFEIVPEVAGNHLVKKVVRTAMEACIEKGETSLDVTSLEGAYRKPSVTQDDEALNAQVDDLNTYMDLVISYTLTDGSVVTLDHTLLKDWISVKEDDSNYYYVNTDVFLQKVTEFIADLAAADDHTYDTFDFASTNLGTVSLPVNKKYGHALDQAAMTEELYQTIINRSSVELAMTYASNTMMEADLGGTYVEVDIPNQHVYLYVNGELLLDTECVSGLESSSGRRTPTGIYQIYSKEKNRDLKGRLNEEGVPSYVSHVNFWMPFYGGYGLHDASWRSYFGGDIYLSSGSHGCVNLEYSAAETLYNNVSIGTYVVIVRG